MYFWTHRRKLPQAMDKPTTSPTATPVTGQTTEICLSFKIAKTTETILAYIIW